MASIQPAEPKVNEVALASLKTIIQDLGAGYRDGWAITDGVTSNKVRAFTAVFEASSRGEIFGGQALAIATDWSAACGDVLSDKSKASAASKARVWIIAGKTNYAGSTMRTMQFLAGTDRKLSGRFFEKLTTALRRSKKEGRPLSEHECKLILTGESEEQKDDLELFVAALARVVLGYKAAREVFPADASLVTLEQQAIVNHAVAKAELDKRVALARVAKVGGMKVASTAPMKVLDDAADDVSNEVDDTTDDVENNAVDGQSSEIINVAHVEGVGDGLFVTT